MKAARFNLAPGRVIAGKYVVDGFLGDGWEGEVYRIVEEMTGIGRAAKFFYPERNVKNKTLRQYAQKLEKLSYCPLVIRYHTHDRCRIKGNTVDFFVSDIGEGVSLPTFLKRQRGGRLTPIEGMILLRELAAGLEMIHNAGEYHGDLHGENILVQRRGIGFDLRLIDFYHRGRLTRDRIHDDVCDSIRIFYDAIGGKKHYAKLSPETKYICAGLKRTLIAQRFRTAGALRQHLETFHW